MKRLFGKAKHDDPSLQFDKAWQDLPHPKTPRHSCGMAMWGSDKIVVAGGLDRNFQELRSVEMYNISSCKWTNLPPMSRPRSRCAAIVVKDKLYVFGGYNIDTCSHLSECEVLDLAKPDSEFTRLPNNLPRVLRLAVVVSKGHLIYVIGGKSQADHANTVYVLDTKTNQWNDKLPRMKEKRALPAVAFLGDTLVVAGGFNVENGILKSVETLDLATEKWTNTIKPMPSPRKSAIAFVEEGSSNLIIAGGECKSYQPARAHLRYDGSSWTEHGKFPPITEDYNGYMVATASRNCIYYIHDEPNFKVLSFTINHGGTATSGPNANTESGSRTQEG